MVFTDFRICNVSQNKMDYLIFKEVKRKHVFVKFFGGFELEMPSFYRQEVWNVRQGRTWHFAIWSCLKGQERHFALKGNFLFSPCAIFGNLIQSSKLLSLTDIYQFIHPLGKARKLLDEEIKKWPIIWCLNFEKSSFMDPFVPISKT